MSEPESGQRGCWQGRWGSHECLNSILSAIGKSSESFEGAVGQHSLIFSKDDFGYCGRDQLGVGWASMEVEGNARQACKRLEMLVARASMETAETEREWTRPADGLSMRERGVPGCCS